MRKKNIVVTYSCFGKHLKMEYEKKVLIEDYQKYVLVQNMCNRPVDSIKIIIRKKSFELMIDLLKSENSHCHYRY